MRNMESYRNCVNKKTLIAGDVGTGKTRLTISLLRQAIYAGHSKKITILDLAPKATEVSGIKIGGRIGDFMRIPKSLRYLAPAEIVAPRLSARGPEHLLELVELNYRKAKPLMDLVSAAPTPVLFVNDISIYVQSGRFEPMGNILRASQTFVANGYSGTGLASDYGTGVTAVETALMEKLASMMDRVIRL